MIKLRAALRRWFWLLVVGALAGAAIGGVSAAIQGDVVEQHEATSIVLFDVNRSSTASQQAAQQAGLRVRRGEVPERAAELLDREDPDALVRAIGVEVERDSLSLTIRAIDEDPNEAADIADAFTVAFLQTTNQQELAALDDQIGLLERQLEVAQQRLDEFDASNPLIAPLTDLRVPLVQERSGLVEEVATISQQLDETRQQRETATGPYSSLGEPIVVEASRGVINLPSETGLRVGLLGAVGALLAALLIALLERWNPRIDTKEEAEAVTQLPVLTMVPYVGRRHRPSTPAHGASHFGGNHAEAYRRLRSALQYVAAKPAGPDESDPPRARSFLVVSSSPGEGKTSTVEFTALALAEADVPTMAINADTRRPTLHQRLGLELEPGLADLGELSVDRPGVDDVAQPGPVDNLWVISSGEPGALTNEIVDAVDETIGVAIERGATVVVDSSPLLATADAMELIPMVDHVLFVIRNGRTTRKEALDGLEMLQLREAPLLGCVCVGSPGVRRRYPYYQSYYYDGPGRGRSPVLDPTPGNGSHPRTGPNQTPPAAGPPPAGPPPAAPPPAAPPPWTPTVDPEPAAQAAAIDGPAERPGATR